jgi:hypothetical protein
MLEMNMFNELISNLDLTDVPFSGKEFTWSNMQAQPLLVKLDWVLTFASWPLSYPATHVQPLSRPILDHIPYVIHIGSNIPKANVFRFENYWMEHLGFYGKCHSTLEQFTNVCKCSKKTFHPS